MSGVARVIREIRERRGPERARHSKIVLSGLFGLAVRHDALDANQVRELSRSRKKRPQLAVELTDESLAALGEHLCASPDAHKHDLVDLVDVLSGLGCRIGELLALDWTKVDQEAGTLRIEGTVIRVPGEGLIVQPHTKSKAGMRTIHPPGWVLGLFRRRHIGALGEWIFPSTRLTLRDPDNTRARLRDSHGRACICTRSGTWPLSWIRRGSPRGSRHYFGTREDLHDTGRLHVATDDRSRCGGCAGPARAERKRGVNVGSILDRSGSEPLSCGAAPPAGLEPAA